MITTTLLLKIFFTIVALCVLVISAGIITVGNETAQNYLIGAIWVLYPALFIVSIGFLWV